MEQLIANFRQRLDSFSWNAQSLAILLLLGLSFAALLLVRPPSTSTDYQDLFEGRRLTRSELQRAEVALGKVDLAGYVVRDGAIQVPARQRARFLAALEEADSLPSSFHQPTGAAIKATSTFETARINQQRMHHAHEQEVRLAICELRGIEDAFVFFDQEVDRSLQQRKHVTAVVGVRTFTGKSLDLQTLRVIQNMLLGFKVGLTKDDITITDLAAGHSFRGSLEQHESAEVQMLARRDLEQDWRVRIEEALAFVPVASITTRVIPNADSTAAESVRVSVAVPSTYLGQVDGVAEPDTHSLAVETRRKIQSTLQPLLPASECPVDELVSVNFFDIVDPANPSSATTFVNKAFTWILVATCLLSGIFLFNIVGQPKQSRQTIRSQQPASERELRVYTADSTDRKAESDSGGSESLSEPTAKLRAFVAENPEVAAKSLSEFIDRAS